MYVLSGEEGNGGGVSAASVPVLNDSLGQPAPGPICSREREGGTQANPD